MRFLIVLLLLQATPPADPPVETTKKNIKVLTGLPTSQLIPVMAFMANSLGVTCFHCHGASWDSDEKPAKQMARKMIAMQRAINTEQFAGKLTVTCNTCHRGHVRPVPTPDIANAGWNAKTSEVVASVSPEEGLSRFPHAAGVTRRVVRGTVERYNGRDEPKREPFTLTFDGDKISYDTALSHPPEATRAFAIYLLAPPPLERLRGERWNAEGDITRRYRETATALGNLPEEIEYADYRDVGTVRLPYRAQWSRADYRVTFVVEGIEDGAGG